jgi:hypothetical protein
MAKIMGKCNSCFECNPGERLVIYNGNFARTPETLLSSNRIVILEAVLPPKP